VTALLGPYMGLDTETDDKDPEQAHVVEISTVLIRAGERAQPQTTLVNSGHEIPAEAINVHGITNERMVAEGKPAREVIDVYIGELALAVHHGLPLVAQNAAYDLTVLDREARRLDLPTLHDRLDGDPIVVIDPMVLDRRCVKYRRRVSDEQGARTLKTLAQAYGVAWDDTKAHGAEYDTLVSCRVVWKIGLLSQMPITELMRVKLGPFTPPAAMRQEDARAFLEVGTLGPSALHARQADWYREQSEGLAVYFAGKAHALRNKAANADSDEAAAIALQEADEFEAKADSVTYDWPIRPYTAQGALL
jgi:DNA polymerase III subunit epsilon